MAELRSRMEYSEFLEWLAFAKVEPIGDRRTDVQVAMLMATLVNLWSEKKAKPDEFLPDYWADEAAGIEEKFRALATALGQRVETDGTDPRDPGGQAGPRRG